MTFTNTPDYETSTGWPTFENSYVVLEPMTKHVQQPTKYGLQDSWDCIVWKYEPTENTLIPYTGIRIFNKRIVGALSLAYKTGNPLAGHVHKGGKNGSAMVIENDGSPTMEVLAKLWQEANS